MTFAFGYFIGALSVTLAIAIIIVCSNAYNRFKQKRNAVNNSPKR